jgi:LacI family transcriptional regulator/LacI family purine nucleotide synthesis repressor
MKKNKYTTMQDIADKLQLSKNAVSLALSGKPGVSDETRESVINMARHLDYKQKTNDRADSTGSKNILVCIPSYIQNDLFFYQDIYWSIDYRASQKGYNAVMSIITEDMQRSKQLPPICNEMDFVGYLLVGIFDEHYVRFLQQRSPSILSVDHIYYGVDVKSVVTANIEGSYIITKKVIECNHTEIGFVGSYSMTSSIFERWCGFQKALNDAGLPMKQEYIINDNSPLSVLLSDSTEMKQKLLALKSMPTAFVCGGDRIAIAVIDALKQIGYVVPRDISVVGFDDIELSSFIEPKLTTMHVNRKQMGLLAVDLLLKSNDSKTQIGTYSLKPDYICRHSLTQAPL